MTKNATSRYAAFGLGLVLLATSAQAVTSTGFTYGFTLDSYPGPQRAGGIVLADFDGDGRMDAAVPGVYMAGTAIVLDKGTPTVAASWVGSGPWPVALAAGDLDGDGDMDLTVCERDGGGVAILTNGGAGVMTRSAFYATGDLTKAVGPTAVVAADLDKDGRKDLVVANRFAETVVVLHNTAAGFMLEQTVPVTWEPNAMAAADLDGDGWLDVAVACASDDTVKILKNVSGMLGLADTFDGGPYPIAIAAEDLDGDSDRDLVVANREAAQVSVLLNDGTGQFTARDVSLVLPPAITATAASDVLLADADFDGKVDILAGDKILINDGAANFALTTASAYSVAFAMAFLPGEADPFVGYSRASSITVAYQARPIQSMGGDITGDGHVNVKDVLSLGEGWGKSAGEAGFDAACDLDRNNSVNVSDLLIVAENWGR